MVLQDLSQSFGTASRRHLRNVTADGPLGARSSARSLPKHVKRFSSRRRYGEVYFDLRRRMAVDLANRSVHNSRHNTYLLSAPLSSSSVTGNPLAFAILHTLVQTTRRQCVEQPPFLLFLWSRHGPVATRRPTTVAEDARRTGMGEVGIATYEDRRRDGDSAPCQNRWSVELELPAGG